jgi:hypothetical protein
MCSKHDDPSQIDLLLEMEDYEVAYAMKWFNPIITHQAWMDENREWFAQQWNNRVEQSEKYSEALRGAKEMRRRTAAKVIEPVGWWEAVHKGFDTFAEAVEFYDES